MQEWVLVCTTDAIEPEDVIPVEHMGKDYAIYRSPDGEFYASDGHCTHERQLLCDGLVMGGIIECPKHNGRFAYATGKAQGAPVIVDIKTYPVKVEGESVFIDLAG
jgi:3-phenylpropionate/trans-cinnamate dioxygenase ferredoxin subunit